MRRLSKILKCAGGDDTVELMYQDDGDTVKITMEDTKRDKQQECDLKLMDLETEQLGIPEQEYAAKVRVPRQSMRNDRLAGDHVVVRVQQGRA